MGDRDITEKHLEAHDDVFADIVNVLLFKGERRVRPEDLQDTRARSLYKSDGKLHEQERDVSKLWMKGKAVFSLIGFENQTRADRDMPLRVSGYDGADYRAQLTVKGRFYPVITLVLYFGMGHWKKPRSLFERIAVPDELKPFVNDYRLNVFEIAHLTDEQVGQFTSDFRIVADYFVQMRKKRDYSPSRQVVEHVDAVLKLLSALTRDHRFEEVQNDFGEEEGVTMLSVLEKVEARGIQLGRSEGIQLGRSEAARRMLVRGVPLEQIADFTGLSLDEVRALRCVPEEA